MTPIETLFDSFSTGVADLKDPLTSMVFTTGVVTMGLGVLTGLWFGVVVPISTLVHTYIVLPISSRRTARLIFGDEESE